MPTLATERVLNGGSVMKPREFVSALAISVFFCAAAFSQGLVYEEPYRVDYDSPSSSAPGVVVFNGVDHAAFYPFQGPDDADKNLYFRRLDSAGVPSGPQKRVLTNTGLDWPMAAAWDGSAYVVAISSWIGNRNIYLVRVSAEGRMLARQDIDGYVYGGFIYDLPINPFLSVIDDEIFFCFTAGTDAASRRVILVHGPSKLGSQLTATTLPQGALTNANILGMTCDTDGFLALIGQVGLSDHEVKKALLLRIDFSGRPVGAPFPLEETITPGSASGPVFFGSGYLILYTLREGSNYLNGSIVIDAEGNTLSGPNDLGWASEMLFWLNPIWNGRNVSSFAIDVNWATNRFNSVHYTFNSKGKFLADPVTFYRRSNDPIFGSSQAFTGLATTIFYAAPTGHMGRYQLYSNQVSLPPSVTKSSVVYFAAGDSEVGRNGRMIVWSATGCSSVLIKGKGVKLKRLPPVGCAVVKVKGKKLKLTLTVRGPGGKAKGKIVIRP